MQLLLVQREQSEGSLETWVQRLRLGEGGALRITEGGGQSPHQPQSLAWELMSGTSFRGLIPAWAEISFPSPALEGDSYLSGRDDIKVDGLRSDLVKTRRNRTALWQIP